MSSYEPPPNPDDWICDAPPSRHTSESADRRQAAPSRQGEPLTWEAIRAALPAYSYEPRHKGPPAPSHAHPYERREST